MRQAAVTLFALALLLAVAAQGQFEPSAVLTTRPAQPNTLTPVTIVLSATCQCPAYDQTIVRNGNTFTVGYSVNDCVINICIPVEWSYDVGVLPPGTYTVRQFSHDDPSNNTVLGTFHVEAPPIPVTDWRGKMALTIAIALASMMALRRVSG